MNQFARFALPTARSMISRPLSAPVARSFQTSAARLIKVGDGVPSAPLFDASPNDQVDLAKATSKGKFLFVGVPGAFSPGCSQRHIPEYVKGFDGFKDKGFQHIYVICVNDVFVTNAWADATIEACHTQGADGFVQFLADPTGDFSREWDVLFDATSAFGSPRSVRYAAEVDDGKVTKVFVEQDHTGINVSAAPNVFKQV